MKGALIAVHRWLGAALALLFCAWFGSGMVMAFVDDMPYLQDRPERWSRAEVLRAEELRVDAGKAWARLGRPGPPQSAVLKRVGGAPLWVFKDEAGLAVLRADNGTPVAPIDAARARALAEAWAGAPAGAQEALSDDQWTVYAGRFKDHRPLHKVEIEDGRGTWIYVSSASGEVVQAVGRRQRLLAFLGPVVHWMYFTPLRRDRGAWTAVVCAFAGLGALASFSGLLLGVWQFKRKAGSPYRRPWLRWHHLLGLCFGLLSFTWVFSGLLSMTPFGWPWPDEAGGLPAALAGGDMDPRRAPMGPAQALRTLGPGVKELELLGWDGDGIYRAVDAEGKTRLLARDGRPRRALEAAQAEAVFRRRVLTGVAQVQVLAAYDAYYYSKRGRKPLPALKVTLDAPGRPDAYLNLEAPGVDSFYTPMTRLNRWLYSGLHRLDLPFLLRNLSAWYAVVLLFLSAGLALCVTGLVLSAGVLRGRRGKEKE